MAESLVKASSGSVPESLSSFVTNRFVHSTWAGTFHCRPQAIFQPRNVAELQALVNEARRLGKTIMTVGSGHSPLDLTMTTEWVCNLDRFNAILKKEEFYGPSKSDPRQKEIKFVDVTVEAGCRIYELNDYVKAHQLAVQNLGSISEQSVAGLILTGTHGLSQYHGLVSQQVVLLTLINSAGNLVSCSLVDKPNLFRAAMLSLGKIGIITHVTLRLVPRYTIKLKQEIIKFLTLLANWDNLWLDSEFIRIWWFPYLAQCVLWRASKSDEELSDPRPSWYGTWSGRLFYQALLWVLVNVWPLLTPAVEKFVFRQQYGNVETLGHGDIAVQNSVEGLNMDCLFLQFVDEWLAPLKDGKQVLVKLQDAIEHARHQRRYFVHAPIEVRCSNVTNSNVPFVDDETNEPSLYPSQKWLATRDRLSAGPIPGNNFRPLLDNSPDLLPYEPNQEKISNAQLTMFVNATMYRPFGTNVETKTWFQQFEDILSEAGGKPHWAKNFIGLAGDHETVEDLNSQLSFGGKKFYTMLGFDPVMKKWFGQNLVKYNEARRQVDPDRVFLSGKNWMVRNGLLIE